ncbi:MAG: hypothetical protein KGO02_01520 [Alphaproteobacteria bacterium]|nr:hypothetical protein [Alphaproteobacteria bacterium]
MPQTSSDERMRAWVVDYSEARAKAIAWLGDRYLLARPIKRRRPASAPREMVGIASRTSPFARP